MMVEPFKLKATHIETEGNYTRVTFLGNTGKAVVSDPFEHSQKLHDEIRRWLRGNINEYYCVMDGSVVFELESDAMMCYLAYS